MANIVLFYSPFFVIKFAPKSALFVGSFIWSAIVTISKMATKVLALPCTTSSNCYTLEQNDCPEVYNVYS